MGGCPRINWGVSVYQLGGVSLPLSLLKALSGSRKADSKVVNSKVVYSKNAGSRKASSKKVNGFLADFALSLLLLSTKPCKEHFSIYFLKSHYLQEQFSIKKLTL